MCDHLKQLDLTAVRYSGGNPASGYHWRDGVGPDEYRPRVRELAWNTIEPNTFGTDEIPSAVPTHVRNADAGIEPRDREPRGGEGMGRVLQRTRRNEDSADILVAIGRQDPYDVQLWARQCRV